MWGHLNTKCPIVKYYLMIQCNVTCNFFKFKVLKFNLTFAPPRKKYILKTEAEMKYLQLWIFCLK